MAEEMSDRSEYRKQKLSLERDRREGERKSEILKAAAVFEQLDPSLTMPEAMMAARQGV